VIGGQSVLALIPARGGSKGIPRKNIHRVSGRPLIAWTIDAAQGSRYVDRTILSSDDARIIEIARERGCEAPFVREAALATDSATTSDVVADALSRVPGYDIVVVLQPTSPLRTSADIDGVLQTLLGAKAPACVTVRAAEDHPYWTFGMSEAGQLEQFVPLKPIPTRRQDLPSAWCLNGAVYAARTSWFLRERTFLSDQTVGYPMPPERSLDIDTLTDVSLLEEVMDGKASQNPDL
jgi:CMP-N,N'-diacetyllegionaminic acid synthase